MLDIVILAAGKGTRMRSVKPKVLHPLAGKALVAHVLDKAYQLDSDNINVIVGHGAEQVSEALEDGKIRFIEQREQLGTGHAVQQTLEHLRDEATVLILYGDVPLIETETLRRLLFLVSEDSMALLTVELEDPTGYGRIVRNSADQVCAIVEQKDANTEQLAIKEINTGVMAVKGKKLKQWLPQLSNNNAQGEYYLTDIIAMATEDDVHVKTAHPTNAMEVMGINDHSQQAELERYYQCALANKLMAQGLTLVDPQRFDCRGELSAGSDCLIDVNCVFEGQVHLGDHVNIGPNCVIRSSTIGDHTTIEANSLVEDSAVAGRCTIGPFARLRPGSQLANGAKVGNFVEIKQAIIGEGSKVNHLSYVGDAELGAQVNIGAGTITCNYDGANKHKTEIDDGVFVGSNTALVAPVRLGKDATVAAGSTITRNVGDNQLALTRVKQTELSGWKRPEKQTKK